MNYKIGIFLVFLLLITGSGLCFAADHYLILHSSGASYAWDHPDITIEVGDRVLWRNFSSVTIYVNQTSGDCTYYSLGPIYGQPYPAMLSRIFDEGPCDSYYEDDFFNAAGVIHVVAAATATPDPTADFPSMSPGGIAIALFFISLLLILPVLRKS